MLGTGGFGYKATVSTKELAESILSLFKKHGGNELDSARIYGEGTAESILGDIGYEALGFILDTKVPPFPGSQTPDKVHKSVEESLSALKTKKVHILYLHGPDRTTPFEQTLEAINEEYKKGRFEKFGLSNFTAEEVLQIIEISKKHGYVQPTVYQGLYNILSRTPEDVLFPVLRQHGISFYAYSPLAGSFLTESGPNESGRFSLENIAGKIYRDHYYKDSHFKALSLLKETAAKHGLTVPELAFCWLNHHSQLKRALGDAIIIGGSRLATVENSIVNLEKPALSLDVIKVADEVWQIVKGDAASYHF